MTTDDTDPETKYQATGEMIGEFRDKNGNAWEIHDDGHDDPDVSVSTNEDVNRIPNRGMLSGLRMTVGDAAFERMLAATHEDAQTAASGESPSPSEIARDPRYWRHTGDG